MTFIEFVIEQKITIVGTKNNNYGWNEKIRRPKDDANNKHSQE